MLYLLMLGWGWFAGAFAVGAIVGFTTTTRAKDAELSGRWVIVAAVLVLGAGGAISALGVLSGREALTFDIALLAGLAYCIGLPVGGAAKSLAPARAQEMKKPPVVVLRGSPRKAQAPAPIVVEPQPASALAAVDGAADVLLFDEAPAHEAPASAPEPPTPKKRAARANGADPSAFAGAPPESLSAPRGGAPDDLAKIKGLGPRSVEKLNALGVYHYDQIAAWNLDNAKWIGAALGAVGRVERGKWIQQARDFAAGGKVGGSP